jgi:hypothetical protein
MSSLPSGIIMRTVTSALRVLGLANVARLEQANDALRVTLA